MYLTFNSFWDKPITGEKKADVAHAQDITSCKLRTLLFSVYWAVYVIINHDSMNMKILLLNISLILQ